MNEEAGSSGPKPSAAGTSMHMPAMGQFVIQPGEELRIGNHCLQQLLPHCWQDLEVKVGLRAIARVCEEKVGRSGISQRSDRTGKP